MTDNQITILQNADRIRERIAKAAIAAGRNPQEIALVAVSKGHHADAIRFTNEFGFFAYGENRVQELLSKAKAGAYGSVPLHLIGTLQKNKVNKIVGRVQLIQSVDSMELACLIGKRAAEQKITQEILVEVNIGGERSKGGIRPEEADEFVAALTEIRGIRVRGLMAIPPKAEKTTENLKYFAAMRKLFVDITGKKYDNVTMSASSKDRLSMDCLSMGMSDDFEAAIAEGATMVRIGSAIFGPRSR